MSTINLFPLRHHAGPDGLRLNSNLCTVFSEADMCCEFFIGPVQDDEGNLVIFFEGCYFNRRRGRSYFMFNFMVTSDGGLTTAGYSIAIIAGIVLFLAAIYFAGIQRNRSLLQGSLCSVLWQWRLLLLLLI